MFFPVTLPCAKAPGDEWLAAAPNSAVSYSLSWFKKTLCHFESWFREGLCWFVLLRGLVFGLWEISEYESRTSSVGHVHLAIWLLFLRFCFRSIIAFCTIAFLYFCFMHCDISAFWFVLGLQFKLQRLESVWPFTLYAKAGFLHSAFSNAVYTAVRFGSLRLCSDLPRLARYRQLCFRKLQVHIQWVICWNIWSKAVASHLEGIPSLVKT